MTSEKENIQNQKELLKKDRRTFLKKAAYAAPSILVLGQLARPAQSKAWGEPVDLPSQPTITLP